jgi:diamine N-acetyltransferase
MQKEISEITFKRVGKESIEEIRKMANVVFPVTYGQILSENQLKYMLEMMYSVTSLERQFDEGCEFYICKDDGQNIGFGSFQLFDKVAKLHKIYFLPKTQGKGYGKLFISFVVESVKNKGATELQLNVNRYNNAKIFYEKIGFKRVREEDIEIGEGYQMNDYVMSLIL